MDKFWSITWEIYFTNYNVYNFFYSRYSHWFINEIVQKKLIKFKKKKNLKHIGLKQFQKVI